VQKSSTFEVKRIIQDRKNHLKIITTTKKNQIETTQREPPLGFDVNPAERFGSTKGQSQ
jgi:hypothetical protein